MNDAMIAHFAEAHKLITGSLGLPQLNELCLIDEENERRYSDENYREYRVPVTIVQRGYSTVRSYDPKSAEDVVKVCAGFADGLDNPTSQVEYVGRAVEI